MTIQFFVPTVDDILSRSKLQLGLQKMQECT